MLLDVFNEIQNPEPWQGDHEHRRDMQPRPPLWQAATSPASFEEAGRRGVGVLGTTFVGAAASGAGAGRAVPRGRPGVRAAGRRVLDDQVALFTFVH